MSYLLQEAVVGNLFAFLLIFMRLGTALMLMPGIGDTFVSTHARLLFALALSFILTPFLTPLLPSIPEDSFALLMLLLMEAFIGLFIGTVMRIFLSALDTAGAIVSIQAGLSNAMIFNPTTSTPGSVIGGFYSLLGITLLFATDMHHVMLASIVESYAYFPADGGVLDIGNFSQAIAKASARAFMIGVQMSLPFLVVGLLIQVGFGILGRLMPQLQIFFLALPLQIFLILILVGFTLSTGMLYWLGGFEGMLMGILRP